ncbi:MAG: ABC transporter ATP-binding protein [Bacillota bacterium]
MTNVIFDRVSKQVGGFVLVDEFSMEVREGELVVLVGPMGCGHTSLLRILAGLEEPSRGRILMDGVEVNSIPPQDRGFSAVTDLNPRITIYQNIASALRTQHLSRTQLDQRIREIAATHELDQLLGLKPRDLTGRQYLWTALTKASISRPSALLMNQPLASFCGELKAQAWRDVARFHHRSGATIIYAAYDPTEAMSIADRMVVMRDGRMHQVGTPRAVYSEPSDSFVAGFVGSPPMNLIPAIVSHEEGRIYLTWERGFRVAVPASRREQLQFHIGREVILGIRPEDVQEATGTSLPEKDCGVRATVDLVEYLGAQTVLNLQVGSAPITACVRPETCPFVGDTIELCFDMTRAHIFDKQTERRIV